MDRPSIIPYALSQPIGSPSRQRKVVTVHGKLQVFQKGIAGIEVERGPLGAGGTWEVFDLALEFGIRTRMIQAGGVNCSITFAWDE